MDLRDESYTFDVVEYFTPKPDVLSLFCQRIANYPNLHLVVNNHFGLFFTSLTNPKTAIGIKAKKNNDGSLLLTLVAFSSWDQVKKYFPIVLNPVPYEFSSGSGSGVMASCKNIQIEIPSIVPIEAIYKALKNPNQEVKYHIATNLPESNANDFTIDIPDQFTPNDYAPDNGGNYQLDNVISYESQDSAPANESGSILPKLLTSYFLFKLLI